MKARHFKWCQSTLNAVSVKATDRRFITDSIHWILSMNDNTWLVNIDNLKSRTMKRIIYTLSAAAILMTPASCSVKESPELPDPRTPMTFYVGPTDSSAGTDTRTSLQPDLSVFWSANDRIRVFDGSEYDNVFTLTEGAGSSSGIFEGLAMAGAGTYYALYPYSQDASFTGSEIRASLPAEQHYAAGSFDTMLNPSVAKTDEETGIFTFDNVASLIQVTNNTESAVSSIRINAQSIAGAYTVDMNSNTFTAMAAQEGSLSSVSLSSEDGTSLGTGPYYLVVLPGTYSTLDVSVSFADGSRGNKSYSDVIVEAAGGRALSVSDEDVLPKIELTTEMLSSPHSDPIEKTPLGNLIDNNTETFWTSDWNWWYSSDIGHYIDVDLSSTGKKYRTIKIEYTTRNNLNPASPYTIDLYGYSGEETPFKITTLTHEKDGLPETPNTVFESSAISSPNDFDHIRFAVTRSRQGGKNYALGANGTEDNGLEDFGSFALSEFNIWAK